MNMNNKKIYITPAIRVVNVQTEQLMVATSYNVDGKYGGGIKNQSKEDDWDESVWGMND